MEKINVKVEEQVDVEISTSTAHLELRKGAAYEYHYPGPYNIKGVTIEAIAEFLSKSDITEEFILDSNLIFSLDNRTMKLVYRLSERDVHNINSIIELNPDLLSFGINSGAKMAPFKLADFIKMNRHHFESKSIAMELVSVLTNIKANVNKVYDMNKDDRANRRILFDQFVESNVPESFNIELSVFKGQPKLVVPIEIVIDEDLDCMLISPDLKEIISEQTDLLISTELDKIKLMHPSLRVYQE